jgi:hypothetical protein
VLRWCSPITATPTVRDTFLLVSLIDCRWDHDHEQQFSDLALLPIAGYGCGWKKESAMTERHGKCSACGAPLQVDAAQPFDQAEIVGALCPACTDQQFLALRREPVEALFALGKLTVTAGAVKALAAASQHASEFLASRPLSSFG